jgi:hypothetical protein
MKTQTYTITVITDDNGHTSMTRVNDGFPSMELLGMLHFIINDIEDQIKAQCRPDTVKRIVMED